MHKDLLSRIKRDIDAAKIISFDIFDTLLLRPYGRPTDLFLHLEKVHKCPGFASERVAAEKAARQTYRDRAEVTFDEIYEHIGDAYLGLREQELALEKRVLTPNPEMVRVYEYARGAGKRIIITSDMYLPHDFLVDVLAKNGFGEYEKFYLSATELKTKYRGALYEHIKKDLSVDGRDILHIGDNKSSDYKYAKQSGVNAILYPQVTKQYLHANARARDFKRMAGDDLGASILMTLMAWRWQKKRLGLLSPSYFQDLGYEYAGPVCYGYTRWIEKEAINENLENLFFVARDGYTLQKIFDTFNSDIKCQYVYAPRYINFVCRLDYSPRSKTQAMSIIDYYCAKSPELARAADGVSFNRDTAHKFIVNHMDTFSALAGPEFDNYKNYISKMVHGSQRVGVVDTVTGMFSSQKLIANSLPSGVTSYGLYWSVLKLANQPWLEHGSFIRNRVKKGLFENPDVFTYNWPFIEFLITSPEYPIKNMTSDGMPIYDSNPTEFEKIRKSVYPDMAENAVRFAMDLHEIFGDARVYFSGHTIISYVNAFIKHPTARDVREMSVIRHGADATHAEYVPLFLAKIPFRDFIRHPFKSMKLIRKARWRTIPQSILVCIIDPIKIKMRFPKKLEIYLFPKLFNRYLTLSLTPGRNWWYKFAIGSNKED